MLFNSIFWVGFTLMFIGSIIIFEALDIKDLLKEKEGE